MLDPRDIQAIVETIDRAVGLDNLWLFGSHATGHATAMSDVDLAAQFSKQLAAADRIELQAELAQRLGRAVDLIDLDSASPVLAVQVIKHGRMLVERNPRRRIAFMTILPSRYEDVRRLRAPIERAIAQRMSHGRT